MENESQIWTLGELARVLEAELVGPADLIISAPATSTSDNANGLAFAEAEQYLDEAKASGVGAVIVPLTVEDFPKPHLRHKHPRQAFGHLLHLFDRPYLHTEGIHPTAIVDPTAQIAPTASIGAYVVVEAGAVVAEKANVMPFCYIGENCSIGVNTVVLPHAVLIRNVTVGSNSEIGPGAILGHAGFGYYWDGTKQVRVPQVGGIVVGDSVDIGALTAIDRSTADDTLIADGNKFDNLVQVGHNVKIGKHGVFASQVGIAGSSTIGERMTAGGQSGLADHVWVGDNVTLTGRGGIMGRLEGPGYYGGAPCLPIRQYHRVTAISADLPNLVKRIKALEKKIEELTGSE